MFSRAPKLSEKLWENRPKRGWESISGALPGSLFLEMTAILNYLAPQSLEALPWFAIQTRYRFERKAAAQLQNKGIETFLPVIEESHRWSDRQKVISVPLFSGYVFVRLEPCSARAAVLRTEGVIAFVEFHGDAAPIPKFAACISDNRPKGENPRGLLGWARRNPGTERPKTFGDFDRVYPAFRGSKD